MLISIDWIRDFVDIKKGLSGKELASNLTLRTAEVEGYHTEGEFLEKLRVAQIVSIDKHPEADKLSLVTFKLSSQETLKVVCGAQNLYVGMKAPYAPIGVTLPSGLTLEPKKIRGIVSSGMLCSEEELGLKENSAGLMDLPSETPVGISMLEFFKKEKDVILDIDNKSLTHRPDLWGHYGMAREFAAIFGKTLKNPIDQNAIERLSRNFTNDPSPIEPKVEGDCACLAYYGLSMKNIKVQESPEWVQRRLEAVGLRPINNIVDISNYVMLEYGIPLHIFDRDKIKDNKIIIKQLGDEQEFVTLDNETRKLIPTDTVVCDSTRPLVLAGIMGGPEGGVEDNTSNIFIEVANWRATPVRKTSARLGLRTDSSQRYEKSLDSLQCKRTMFRALELVLELCPTAKVVGKLCYDGTDLSKTEELVIDTSVDKINSVLGTELTAQRVEDIFSALDFKVQRQSDNDGGLRVTVPTYRATKDTEYEADLVEEVGRMVGFDNITPTAPLFKIAPVNLGNAQKLHRKMADYLVYQANAFEIMTYPMVGSKLLKKASWPMEEKEDLVLINSISEEHDRMRPTMVPSLLEAAARNQKNYSQFRFFELGRSYIANKSGKSDQFANDHHQLGVAFFDKSESCFMELVNMMEKFLASMNIPAQLVEKNPKFKNPVVDDAWNGAHPYEYLNIRIMGKLQGAVLSVHPIVLNAFKIKGNMAIAIIDLRQLSNQRLKENIKYKPLSRFPTSEFDCTVLVDNDTPAGKVIDALKKVKIKEMTSVNIMDVYQVNERQKTITLKAIFGDDTKTLSGEFLKESSEAIIKCLEQSGFPLKV